MGDMDHRCSTPVDQGLAESVNLEPSALRLQQNRCDIGFVDAHPLRQNQETVLGHGLM